MSPDLQQTPTNKKKKWLLPVAVGVAVVVIAVIIAVALNVFMPKQGQKPTDSGQIDRTFKIGAEPQAITYANNPVYDACNLMSLETVKKNIPNYQSILDTIGTDKRPDEPLVIAHRYVDRDIAQPLGKDGEARSKGTVLGQGEASAATFISSADSNCLYGQSKDISLGYGKTFAKVFITQRPTPIAQELIAHLATQTKTASEGGFDVYVEPSRDSSGFLTATIFNSSKGIVVISKTSTVELASAALTEIVNTLSQPAKGPMTVTYPAPWTPLVNPCSLLTADDFQHFTGKPTGALAEETVKLTEVGGGQMERLCQRLEIERLNGGDISESAVAIRQSKDVQAAQKYSDNLKNNDKDNITVQPLKQKIALADDAYVKTVTSGDKVIGYELEMRIGAALIFLSLKGETPDASADAFSARILPVALSVVEKYRH